MKRSEKAFIYFRVETSASVYDIKRNHTQNTPTQNCSSCATQKFTQSHHTKMLKNEKSKKEKYIFEINKSNRSWAYCFLNAMDFHTVRRREINQPDPVTWKLPRKRESVSIMLPDFVASGIKVLSHAWTSTRSKLVQAPSRVRWK